jgi:2-polyprenyl-3-methyl-5-hydroxy-6-metoxy-1,4-benzoquinol methylase
VAAHVTLPPTTQADSAGLNSEVCALCGAASCVPIFQKEGVPFFACTSCSFRFAIPQRNANLENTIGEFETSYLQYFREAPRDKINFDKLTGWMSRFHGLEGMSLLDVGCGSGKFVRYLRRRGIEAYGIEPSQALYDHFLAKEEFFLHGPLDVFSGGAKRQFGIVTAFDVVEHVNEPLKTLSLIADLVQPGGYAFVSTPDAGCLHARAMGKRWHYYHRYHLSYWSRSTLESAAARFGLRSRYFGRRSRYQTLGYVLAYFWENILGTQAPAAFERADRLCFPVNLFDVMYLCFEKTG